MTDYNFEIVTELFNTRLERRACLVGAIAGIGLWTTGMLSLHSSVRNRALADLHFVDFHALRGERFHLYGHNGLPSTVQLFAVKNYTPQALGATNVRQECFSLVFCAPKGHGFSQDTYTFVHPQLGYFELFIVPTQRALREDRYIAIINRV